MPACRSEGLPEVIFRRCSRIGCVLQQNKLALDAQQLGDAPTLFAALRSLKCLVDPDLPVNDGFYRLVSLDAPQGTVTNCTWPSSSRMTRR